MFDEARERYNAKQKRKDRMIDNYYEKIRRGKQEKLFHEVIFQIGNKDDMNAKSEDGLLAKRILTEFMDEFQARNPNLYVFSAHLRRMDLRTGDLPIFHALKQMNLYGCITGKAIYCGSLDLKQAILEARV